jgi:hypothetical protein
MKTGQLLLSTLVDAAQQRSGLHDFGNEDFCTPLQILLTSLNEEADLNELGRSLQFERIVELLVNRLRLLQFIKVYPEIVEEEVVAPIVIAGLPRTGTTMLQRVLSMEPAFLATRWYEMRFPVPAFDWDFSLERDERIIKARAEVNALVENNPALLSIHPLDAVQADEDVLLLENTFFSVVPGSQANVPSYNKFFESFGATEAYRYHKKMLQFIQWQRRRSGDPSDGRSWVAALFDVYPDARMIMSHRDPVACIPSVSSLYFAVWKVYSDVPDARVCGEYCKAFYVRGLQRAQEWKDRLPNQFFDIKYRSMIDDPDAVIAELFDFIGVPLLPKSLLAMREWRRENRRSNREVHKYQPEDFGFEKAGLREEFADYCARYDV